MIVVGLTGSIGMGKSTLAAQFRSLDLPVHESDPIVHRLLREEPRIRETFPDAFDNGVIDREKMAGLIYDNDTKRKELESILHPLIRLDRAKWTDEARHKGRDIVVIDVPLLFETNADKECDYILCVTASPDVQKMRVLSRPRMTQERLDKILNLQMPDAEKRKRSDLVIDTSGGLEQTFEQAKKLVEQLRSGVLKLRPKKV